MHIMLVGALVNSDSSQKGGIKDVAFSNYAEG
ncbi:MAG: hypothetical protein K0R22_345 [Sporomusa sp.]|nr:hypothetical protein [Sporomusa sp.]